MIHDLLMHSFCIAVNILTFEFRVCNLYYFDLCTSIAHMNKIIAIAIAIAGFILSSL